MKNLRSLFALGGCLLLASSFAACSDDKEDPEPQLPDDNEPGVTEPANLSVNIWGGQAITEGISADDFVDGWSVTFDTFYVGVEKVRITHQIGEGEESEEIVLQPLLTPKVVDLAAARDPLTLASIETNQGTLLSMDFTIAPIGEHHQGVGLDVDTVEFLQNAGVSGLVSGALIHDDGVVNFEMRFGGSSTYTGCGLGTELGESGEVEITIRGESLFRDSLISDEAPLRGALFAEISTGGTVTSTELANFELSSEHGYEIGDAVVESLYDFIYEQFQRFGRVNGDGSCE